MTPTLDRLRSSADIQAYYNGGKCLGSPISVEESPALASPAPARKRLRSKTPQKQEAANAPGARRVQWINLNAKPPSLQIQERTGEVLERPLEAGDKGFAIARFGQEVVTTELSNLILELAIKKRPAHYLEPKKKPAAHKKAISDSEDEGGDEGSHADEADSAEMEKESEGDVVVKKPAGVLQRKPAAAVMPKPAATAEVLACVNKLLQAFL